MRCYLMRNGHIAAVEILKETDDAKCIIEAKTHFVADGHKYEADGFEIWDAARFVYRFPEAAAAST